MDKKNLQENLGDNDSKKGNPSLERGYPGTIFQLYADSRGLTPTGKLGLSGHLTHHS